MNTLALKKALLSYIMPVTLLLGFAGTGAYAQAIYIGNNSATAKGTAFGKEVADNSNSGLTVVRTTDNTTAINFPMIGIGKVASVPVFQPDGTYNIDYTITVKNFGTTALSNVQVTDVLTTTFPSPLTYTIRAAITATGVTKNASFDGTATNPNLLDASLSALAGGATATIIVPLNINPNGTFGTFNNTANAAAQTPDGTPVTDVSHNNSNPDGNGDNNPFNDNTPTPVTLNAPDVRITKIASNNTPTAGTNITFTITAENIGSGSVANVNVSDVLNAGYTYVSHGATGTTFTPGTGVWNVGNLLTTGGAKTLTLTVTVVHARTAAEYENTASSTVPGDVNTTNNTVTVTTVVPVQIPPVPANDASVGHLPGANATLNLLTNDKLSNPATAATTSNAVVDIDPATAGVQASFTTLQGAWTYNPATGAITFDPATGFTISPTPLTYSLTETATGLSATATVTYTYVPTNPDAVNDASPGNPVGTNVTLNALTNDKLADASAATTATTTVDLNTGTAGLQTTRTVAGQGTWTYNTGNGEVTFDPETGFSGNPTPITYRLTETLSALTDDATITITYVLVNPDAANDASGGHTPGIDAAINVLNNDKLGDLSTATIGRVSVDLDPATTGVQATLNVPAEGVWTYDGTTGIVTFNPNTAFTISPTPIPYRLTETATNLFDDATITFTYVPVNPNAVDDASGGHLAGANATINALANDKLGDGSAATVGTTTVDLDLTTAGVQTTLTVSAEGVWTYNTTTGEVTFDPKVGYTISPTPIPYRLTETLSGLHDDATITFTYVPANPVATDDASVGHTPGANATINALTNDKLADGTAATTGTTTIDLDLVTAGVQTTLNVANQGVWIYDATTGEVTFDPNVGFTISPTAITYRLTETISGRIDDATVTFTYAGTNPVATDDASTGHLPGANATINILTNDKLADGSVATTGTTTVDLDLVTAGLQASLTVSAEGVWTYNASTGEVTFNPNTGYTVDPTPINYRLTETISGLTDDAKVTFTYVPTNPDAANDASAGHLPGDNATINILVNDKLADNSVATVGRTTVDLDLTTAGVQTTLTVPVQGVWTYNPATGEVTFDPNPAWTINPTPITYQLTETISGRADNATITFTYGGSNPDAADNSSTGNAPGSNVTINILANDKLADASQATPALVTVDVDQSSTGTQTTLVVPNEGTWTYNPATGELTFDPIPGFTTDPTLTIYTMTETLNGLTDNAVVTVTYTEIPPDAVANSSTGNVPGTNAVVNILTNDKLSDGTAALPARVTVDLDQVTAGVQTTLVVPNEGTWTYNQTTGETTFDPIPGFTTDPTPITYTLTEIITGLTDNATITVTYTEVPPDAVDDSSTGNVPGVNTVINILTNDKLGDGSPALPARVTVDINLATAGVQTTLVVPNEGTWTYDPATGNLTFDPIPGFTTDPAVIPYTLTEIITGLTDNATVTVTYAELPPEAADDSSTGNVPGVNTVINILSNDKLADGTAALPVRVTADIDPVTAGVQTTLVVPAEGTWTYDPATGNLTFDPIAGFTTDPAPITYILTEIITGLTDNAVVTIGYTEVPPVAADNSSTGHVPGTNVILDILANDKLSDGSPALPVRVDADLDLSAAGIQHMLIVSDEGTWTYDQATGNLTFDPIPGFTTDPTPVTYRLLETYTGLSDDAVVTVTYTEVPPEAVNDSSTGNIPGVNTVINILSNDKLSDGSPALPARVTADLDAAVAGVQTTLVVPNEGTWTYDPATGNLTFDPNPGFTISPTPISYRLTEVITGLTDNATVTVTYNQVPPDAVNDASTGHAPGSNAVLNILTNDKLSDGTAIQLSSVSIDLDPTTPALDNTLVATGQGTWTYNPANGEVTFDPIPGYTLSPTAIPYRLTELSTGLNDAANISVTYLAVVPDAADDSSTGHLPGTNATLNLVNNDKLSDGSPATLTLINLDLDPSAAGIQLTRTIAGEGVWTYNPANGEVTFDPNTGYTLSPTPIQYRLTELATGLSDVANILVTYVAIAPDAVDDHSAGNSAGINAVVNVLTNDKLSDGSPAPATSATVDLDPSTPGMQLNKVVAGEGTWSYDPASGTVTFDPDAGFTISPTPVPYRLIEIATGLTDDAKITVTYIPAPPTAENNSSGGHLAGTNAVLNILANDRLADGSPALPALVTVDIDLAAAGNQTTLVVAGQGTWTFAPATGELTFDPNTGFAADPSPIAYILTEKITGLSDNASVTVDYDPVPPTAVDDNSTTTTASGLPNANILSNDKLSDGSPAILGSVTVDLDPNAPGIQTSRVVTGEGSWTFDPGTGEVVFQAIVGFVTDPTPISYVLIENQTGLSSTARITVKSAISLSIGLAKRLTKTQSALNGSYELTFEFQVKNHGNVALTNVGVIDNLRAVFPIPMQITVKGVTTTGTVLPNTAYDGNTTSNMLQSGSTLAVGASATVTMVVNVLPNGNFGMFENTATATGTGAVVGGTATDISTNGTNTDPDGNNVPGNSGESQPTPVDLPQNQVKIPEGFSPNNDGINDKFIIENTGLKQLSIEIFNRWGNRVYRSANYKNDWDGRCTEGISIGQDLPVGTYFYIVRVEGKDKYVGYITLNR